MAGASVEAGRAALSGHFRAAVPGVLADWRQAIAADRVLAANRSLPRSQLEDHLPSWLESFAAVLGAAPGEPAAESAEARDAEAHGTQRWQQGYDLHEVTREWACLHRCLVAELERFVAAHPELPAELAVEARLKLAEQIGEALSLSAEKYFRLERVAAAGSVHDLERALADVRDLERKRAELWQQAAHDLRGNLGVVSNVAEGLHFQGLPAERRQDFLAMLRNNVTALRHLLDDVTELARLQAGQEKRRLAEFDAAELLQGLAGDVRVVAEARGLFVATLGPDRLDVEGDPVKVRRVAQNLLLNALKYTASGGVTIEWGDAAPATATAGTSPFRTPAPDSTPARARRSSTRSRRRRPSTSRGRGRSAARRQRRRRLAAGRASARRGHRLGDREAPVRPARRRGRDRVERRARHPCARPVAVSLSERASRAARRTSGGRHALDHLDVVERELDRFHQHAAVERAQRRIRQAHRPRVAESPTEDDGPEIVGEQLDGDDAPARRSALARRVPPGVEVERSGSAATQHEAVVARRDAGDVARGRSGRTRAIAAASTSNGGKITSKKPAPIDCPPARPISTTKLAFACGRSRRGAAIATRARAARRRGRSPRSRRRCPCR